MQPKRTYMSAVKTAAKAKPHASEAEGCHSGQFAIFVIKFSYQRVFSRIMLFQFAK